MLPPLLLMRYCGPDIAGIFFVTAQLLAQSMAVLRRSGAQFVLGEGRFIERERYMRAGKRLRSLIGTTMILFALAWVTLALSGNRLSRLILGDQWELVGGIATVLLPMFACDAIGFVYTQILVVRKRYRTQLLLEALKAAAGVGGLIVLLELRQGPVVAVAWLSVSTSAAYAVIVYIAHREIERST
jgi:O-antigen/teichoic acid export membrane protein